MIKNSIKKIKLKLSNNSYDIIIGKNTLDNVSKYFNLNRKVLIVTDSNIPITFIKKIKKAAKNCFLITLNPNEKNKNFTNYKNILTSLVKNNFTRSDAVIAIGGGMIGDIAGFSASTYMRGIDFYNIPTTLLSQVDSSIGGKTAIDFSHIKNIIGTFYQPKCVLIDTNTLKTLSKREINSGLVESIKIAATFDKKFFNYLKTSPNIIDNAEEIIYKSLLLKKAVVEKDEKEKNLRKVLNFGHTIGHAIEESTNYKYLHGECVGMGMLYFSSDNVKLEIEKILDNYGIPTKTNFDANKLIKLIKHDKKANDNIVSTIYVEKIGTYKINNLSINDIYAIISNNR